MSKWTDKRVPVLSNLNTSRIFCGGFGWNIVNCSISWINNKKTVELRKTLQYFKSVLSKEVRLQSKRYLYLPKQWFSLRGKHRNAHG